MTHLILSFLVFLCLCFSCGKKNNPQIPPGTYLSDPVEEQLSNIKKEVQQNRKKK